MVQQMIESKLIHCGLGDTGTGFPPCDKQSPVTVKKTALRDLQNDHRILAPRHLGSSPFVKERGSIMDAIKFTGTKRPSPECPPGPSCQESSSSNGANAHLVYVRRKSEAEVGKSTKCNMDNSADCSQEKQPSHKEGELHQQQSQTKGFKIPYFPAFAPIPMASSMTYSSGGPSVPHSHAKPVNRLSPTESNYPTVSSANILSVNHQVRSDQHYTERSLRLQAFLTNCDHANQEEYIKMLRSLSSAGRSRHALELENRAIQLSLEEGNELGRMTRMNILGKHAPKNNSSRAAQQVQTQK